MKSIRRMIQEETEQDDVVLLTESAAPVIRSFGAVNWLGLWTLIVKEIHRFAEIWNQSIISPLVMTLLFYAVFALGMGNGRHIEGIPYVSFLLPGIVMMSMAQNAFMNTASSIILSKIHGSIVDVLMPPLSPMELVIGYTIGGVVRALMIGAVSLLVLSLFAQITIYDIGFIAYHAIMGSTMLSLIGIITGIWGDKFDHLGAIQNYLILPATFLSGTFYSITSLPPGWEPVCLLNPFFYMIDGFRYGFTGHADGPLWGGVAVLLIFNLALFNVAYWLFAKGTRLKP